MRSGAWIHTDSEYVAAEVRDIYRIEPHRVLAVPLGVRLPPAGPHPAPGSPYVLALGSADRRKGLTTLVAAFDALAVQHRDLRLIHAGPDGDASDKLADAIGRSPHHDRILRLGWVDDGARTALIEQAAAVAYPSLYEGFGLVPLEAMAAGRPVVTTPGVGHSGGVGRRRGVRRRGRRRRARRRAAAGPDRHFAGRGT